MLDEMFMNVVISSRLFITASCLTSLAVTKTERSRFECWEKQSCVSSSEVKKLCRIA